MADHKWIKSMLGHGNLVCQNCAVTDLEAAAIGMVGCEGHRAAGNLVPDHLYEDEQEETPPPPFYTVCPFLVDRAYGGPEEGGWWYDVGEPAIGPDFPVPVICHTREEAEVLAGYMQRTLNNTINVGRYPVESVLSNGSYQAQVCEEWPKAYPDRRPHYE